MTLEQSSLHELHWLMEMLHNIDVGLVVLDRDYTVQLWNGFMENHSGLLPRQTKDKVLFDLFDDIPKEWFIRKAESVFLLKNKAFTIWEQRPYLFKFNNYRPITGTTEFMYQNTTFMPLISATGEVTHLCLIVYDVTDNAVHKTSLEKLNDDLSILSQTDGLTGLFNRIHWESCLQSEFKRWLRTQNTASLIMLDIDFFKKINDGYGHMAGDEVIRHVSKLIKHYIRETDTSGRYGGEEFTILLPNTELRNAYILAERIRKAVELSAVYYNDIKLNYTVSIGVAELSETIDNYEKWIECADAAMYQSKESGRNKVSLYLDPQK